MSQATTRSYLTPEWQTTDEVHAKALAEDPRATKTSTIRCLNALVRKSQAERAEGHTLPGKPAQWRLRP
jgi:hypothetical protein